MTDRLFRWMIAIVTVVAILSIVADSMGQSLSLTGSVGTPKRRATSAPWAPSWSDPNSAKWHMASYFNSPTNVTDAGPNGYYFDASGIGPAVMLIAPSADGQIQGYASIPDLAPVAAHGTMTNRSTASLSVGTNDYTLTYWIRILTAYKSTVQVGSKYSSSSYRWSISMWENSNWYPAHWGKSATDITYIQTNSAVLPTGLPGLSNKDWHFFAVTNDRDNTNNSTIFYDGTNATTGSTISGAGVNISFAAPLALGRYNTAFNGEFDICRLAVYLKVLSEAEIVALHANTHPARNNEILPAAAASQWSGHAPMDVHLLFGQSNCRAAVDSSTGLTAAQTSQDGRHKVMYVWDNIVNKPRSLSTYGTGAWGAEIVGGANLYDLSGTNLAFMKVASDGKGLGANFMPGGDMWIAATNYLTWALPHASNYLHASPVVRSMGFIGCESDGASATYAPAIVTNLPNFFSYMTDELAPFVASDCVYYCSRLPVSNALAQAATARTAQTNAIANMVAGGTNAFWIDTDGFGLQGDNVHFDSYGQISMGSWMSSGVWYRVENHP